MLMKLSQVLVVNSRNSTTLQTGSLAMPQAIYKLVYGFALCRVRIWAFRFRYWESRQGTQN